MDTSKQDERFERARAALANGEYKITPLEDGVWSIINGDNTPYRVTPQTCECKDFQHNEKHGVMCKHICAIHILFPEGGQSKMNEPTTPNPVTGWTRLYHSSGAQVTLPIAYTAAGNMYAQVDAYLGAGFQVNAPGLEEGEQKQGVVSVSRRESKDSTPIVAFYLAHPKTVKKFLHAYLNNQEDVLAFEAATGLRLDAIPLWPGERDIDKDSRQADEYIIPLPHPVNIVWEVNPKWQTWSAEGGKSSGALEPHKRILVRYDAVAAKPVTGPLPALPGDPKPASGALVRKYQDGTLCKDDPAERVAFDAYTKANNNSPASLEALRAWYRTTGGGK
ncbi:MAG: SWIM zinc finger family protein [Anaerolineales bacterium]|jgi:hypothetical protein|nr:SWIM zinc finger family protein [Anaerolineales bacterium]